MNDFLGFFIKVFDILSDSCASNCISLACNAVCVHSDPNDEQLFLPTKLDLKSCLMGLLQNGLSQCWLAMIVG